MRIAIGVFYVVLGGFWGGAMGGAISIAGLWLFDPNCDQRFAWRIIEWTAGAGAIVTAIGLPLFADWLIPHKKK